jgi:hypothetical protein
MIKFLPQPLTASFTLVLGSFLFFVAMGWEHESERFRNMVSVELNMNLAGVEAGGGIKVLESRLRMKWLRMLRMRM